jgi:ribosomal protein S18 acetylase RimI-like enzyme
VLILWRTVFAATFPYLDDPPNEQDFLTYFDEVILPSQRIWVAQHRGRIIGFLSASRDEILNLFVSASHQRRGIGTLLLAAALREQPEIRTLSTIAANLAARRFYEKNGFVFLRTEPHTFVGQQAAIYHLRAK